MGEQQQTAVRQDRGGRRGEILQIAAEVFARKGFAAATVRDIAQEAGILSGSLYHHFDSKDTMVAELLEAFFQRVVRRYDAALQSGADPLDVLREFIHIAIGTLTDDAAEIRILHNDWPHLREQPRFEHLLEQAGRVDDVWRSAIRAGMASGQLRDDLDPNLIYRTVMGSVLSTVRWYHPDGALSIGAIADVQAAIFVDGLRAGNDGG